MITEAELRVLLERAVSKYHATAISPRALRAPLEATHGASLPTAKATIERVLKTMEGLTPTE